MSNFTTVSDWINVNTRTIVDPSTLQEAQLRELQEMADNEVPSLMERAFRTMRDYQGQNGMRALSAISLNTHNPNAINYMDNAFGIVLLKSDPNSTDGIFVVLQIVPDRYVLKTVIRATRDYVTTNVTHSFLSLFDSSLTKPFMVTGSNNGTCQQELFEHKRKHDEGENIDPQLERGSNAPFIITRPDGGTYEP